jgi:hypothetical protein
MVARALAMSLSQPRILAHRGASGAEPENSLAAFRAAFSRRRWGGADVHARDGALIVPRPVIRGLGVIASSMERLPGLIEQRGANPHCRRTRLLAGAEVWIELKSLLMPPMRRCSGDRRGPSRTAARFTASTTGSWRAGRPPPGLGAGTVQRVPG